MSERRAQGRRGSIAGRSPRSFAGLVLLVALAVVAGLVGMVGPLVGSAQAASTDAVANPSAEVSAASWVGSSDAGTMTVSRVTGLSGAFTGTTAIDVSRPAGTGTWAQLLGDLTSPTTYFVVGTTYRMQAWVRDANASGGTIGLLLANSHYTNQPTAVGTWKGYTDTAWHLQSVNFVATSTGSSDTKLYVSLPLSGAIHYQLTNVSVAPYVAAAPVPATSSVPARVLTWSGAAGTAIDASAWNHDVGGAGWGNGELETYTASTRNSSVDGKGNLVITTRREDVTGPDGILRHYSSARITTYGKVLVPPGSYVEAPITAPVGAGMWPAFWLMGQNLYSAGWPACGEIDVLEGSGSQPTIYHTAMHAASTTSSTTDTQYGWGDAGGTVETGSSLDSRQHTFGIYFDAATVRLYLDGKQIRALWAEDALAAGHSWPFGQSMFLLLNTAVSSGSAVDTITMPRTMTVGPISIWKGLPTGGAPTPTPTATVTVTPTATPTPTVSVTPTATPTPTVSVTPTATPTPTVSVTPTATPTPTVSVTPTATPTPTVSVTPSPTPTPTLSTTPSPTPTPTLSTTPSPTPTPTASTNPSPTPSASAAPKPTSSSGSGGARHRRGDVTFWTSTAAAASVTVRFASTPTAGRTVALRAVAGSSKVVSVHAVSVRWFVNGHMVRGARTTKLPLAHSSHGARVYARVVLVVNGTVRRVVRTSVVRVR